MSLSPFQLIVVCALVALFFLALGVGSTYLMMRVRAQDARIQALEAVQKPAAAVGNKRLPYEAADELLDAMAVLDAAREKRLIEVEYVDNVRAHLAKALETGTKRAGTSPAPTRDEDAL